MTGIDRGLFIGRSYVDNVVIADHWPEGDEKTISHAYAVSFGGNAVTAAFACARLGSAPDLITTAANDWYEHLLTQMYHKYGINVHGRRVQRTPISIVRSHNGKRSMIRARDEEFLDDFPHLDVSGYRALHLDGHQPDAALYYAKLFRERNLLTSLDGGRLRENTDELLGFIDVAVVSNDLCEQMNHSSGSMLTYLRRKGCRAGAVTMGKDGLLWFDDRGTYEHMSALSLLDEQVVDTNGAGDIFHGAYLYSYLMQSNGTWRQHFLFARAAAAFAVQRLGNEASCPTVADVESVLRGTVLRAAS